MKIKVINRSAFELPHYETVSAAGLDVRANTTESIVLEPLQRALVPTGLYVEIPDGYEIQVRPRSGLAAKHGISVPVNDWLYQQIQDGSLDGAQEYTYD